MEPILFQDEYASECFIRRIIGNTILYVAANFAGMYTKYLADRSQRKAFLETHRSTETRYRTQIENSKQEKLFLSGKRILRPSHLNADFFLCFVIRKFYPISSQTKC